MVVLDMNVKFTINTEYNDINFDNIIVSYLNDEDFDKLNPRDQHIIGTICDLLNENIWEDLKDIITNFLVYEEEGEV